MFYPGTESHFFRAKVLKAKQNLVQSFDPFSKHEKNALHKRPSGAKTCTNSNNFSSKRRIAGEQKKHPPKKNMIRDGRLHWLGYIFRQSRARAGKNRLIRWWKILPSRKVRESVQKKNCADRFREKKSGAF